MGQGASLPSSERSSRALLCAALVSTVLPGCFTALDLSERRCPCDEGWTCDTSVDRCVQRSPAVDAGAVDAAGMDAAGDASSLDAAALDASALGDGAIADAATQDAPAQDAAPPPMDAGGFVWCPSSALLCDDFESSDADRTPPWSWTSGGTSRVTDMVHRGAAAGRFFAAVGVSQHQVGLDLPSGAAADIWVRGHVRVASGVTIANVGIAVIGEGIPPYENASLIFGGAGASIYSTLADRGWGSLPIPRDRWVCYVYHLRMAADGFAMLEVDGASFTTDRHDSRFATGANDVAVGITYVGPSQTEAFEIRYDDVAITVDGTPLSCPP